MDTSELSVVVPNAIWVSERPVWFSGVRLRARSTVVRLEDGGLLVHSPPEPTEEFCAALRALVNGVTILVGVIIMLLQDWTLGLVILGPGIPVVVMCALFERRYALVARRALASFDLRRLTYNILNGTSSETNFGAICGSGSGNDIVRMSELRFGAQVPIITGQVTTSNASLGSAPVTQVTYQNIGLRTDISMREGSPVIAGTLNVGPQGDAIVVVISARRAN